MSYKGYFISDGCTWNFKTKFCIRLKGKFIAWAESLYDAMRKVDYLVGD